MANVLQWNQTTNSFSVSGSTAITPVVGEGIDNNFSVAQTFGAGINQTASAGSNNQSALLNTADVFSDFIASGLQWTVPSPANLTSSMAPGVATLNGTRTIVPAVSSYTFPASNDTYVSFNNSGVPAYQSVANGAAAPAPNSGYVQTAKVVTSPIVSPAATLSTSTSGSLASGTYGIALVAFDATGYGAVGASGTVAVTSAQSGSGSIELSWVNPLNETSMDIYATTAGSTTLGLVASGVTGTTYTYTGSVAPGAAAPTTATSNAVQRVVAFLPSITAEKTRVSLFEWGGSPTGDEYSDAAFYAANEYATAIGGYIDLGGGVYAFSGPINLTTHMIGNGTATLEFPFINENWVTTSGPANLTLSGFKITSLYNLTGSNPNTGTTGLSITQSLQDCFISRVTITNAYNGFLQTAGSAGGLISNVYIYNNGGTGFHIDMPNITVSDSYALANGNYGFYFTSSKGMSGNIVLIGCTSFNNTNGNIILQGQGPGYGLTDAVLSNLTISTCPNGHGLLLDTYGSRNSVFNIYAEMSGQNVSGVVTGPFHNISVTANNTATVVSNINSSGAGDAGVAMYCNDFILSSVMSANDGLYSSGSRLGVLIDGDSNFSISDVVANTATGKFGIGFGAASVSGVTLSNMLSSGSFGTAIYVAGSVSGDIFGCPGFGFAASSVPISAPDAATPAQLPTLGQTNGLYQSSNLAVASTTTSGAITATAAQLAGGYLADGATQTAAFTVTTDTAANILAQMPNAAVGTSFKFRFINNDQSSTGYAGTLAGGTGVTVGTVLPNPAIPKGAYMDYLFTFTAVGSSPTLTVEAVGGNSSALL